MSDGLLIRLKREGRPCVAVTVTAFADEEAATAERIAEALESEFGASEYEVVRE